MVGVALMIVTGCAAKKSTYSGFLGNYPIFKPGPKDGADLIYLKKHVDFRAYNKVMMDHVVFYFKKDADYKGIHSDELKELTNAFHLSVANALKGAYPLVSKAGTAVGALIREAEFGQSRADFTSKMSMSLKEANETEYWLSVLKDTDFINEDQFGNLQSDCKELIAMLVSTVKTSKS